MFSLTWLIVLGAGIYTSIRHRQYYNNIISNLVEKLIVTIFTITTTINSWKTPQDENNIESVVLISQSGEIIEDITQTFRNNYLNKLLIDKDLTINTKELISKTYEEDYATIKISYIYHSRLFVILLNNKNKIKLSELFPQKLIKSGIIDAVVTYDDNNTKEVFDIISKFIGPKGDFYYSSDIELTPNKIFNSIDSHNIIKELLILGTKDLKIFNSNEPILWEPQHLSLVSDDE